MAQLSVKMGHGPKLGSQAEKDLKEIEAYENMLRAQSVYVTAKLYNDEKKKHNHEMEKISARESKCLFSQSCTSADFQHWGKAAYWHSDEAIALSFGKNPEKVNWGRVKQYISVSLNAKKYSRLRDLVHRAIESKQLNDPVSPGNFLVWANQMEVNVPFKLVDQVMKHQRISNTREGKCDELKKQNESLQQRCDAVEKELAGFKKTSSEESLLLRSDYWKKLTKNAAEAVNQYPSWRITEKKVQKSANLHDWLKNKFSLTDRETEIIKKILSEIVDII